VHRPTACLLAALLVLAAASAAHAINRNVEIVVESELYSSGAISAGLAQYAADITAQGWTPIITPWVLDTNDINAAATLRSHLAARQQTQGLSGTVFIGHLPVQNVYVPAGGGISGESTPCDLFFMDLDGSWTSSGAYGFLPDTHAAGTGDIGPDIFFGRLTTWNMTLLHPGRTEASLLNAYFAKNHAYRTGALTVPRTGLVYTEDDWTPGSRVPALELAVDDVVTSIWNDPAVPGDPTTAADYKWRLANESYEHVLLSAHSSATLHQLTGGTVTSSELDGLAPENLFYNLFACSAAKFTDFGCIGNEYIFGAGDGLIVVSSSKTGSMQSHTMEDYFGPLGLGATFGEALQAWWIDGVDPDGHTATEAAWSYGMTILGDPLLQTQTYMPEPATLALLAAGLVALTIRRRRP
jgi:hypothetical protein